MTDERRWLDELPLDAPERDLLAAGKSAKPPEGSADIGWQAMTVALGAAAVTTTVTTQAIATTAAAAKAGSIVSATSGAAATSATVAAKLAVGGVGMSLATKAIAIGFAVGMGAVTVGTIYEHGQRHDAQHHDAQHRDAQPKAVASVESPARAPSRRPMEPSAIAPTASTQPDVTAPNAALSETAVSSTVTPAVDQLSVVPATALKELPAIPSQATAHRAATVASGNASAPATQIEPKPVSLADQARELAQVKRLVDAGATGEALRRLEASRASDLHTALSEERDALYIQALDKAQHRAQAELFAKRFLARYPNSPHAEKMRTLIASE